MGNCRVFAFDAATLRRHSGNRAHSSIAQKLTA